jgi:iron complex transport system ATP-binding protein
MIHTQNLSVKIGNTTVCENLNWDIQQGDRWAILGINGSGKTTLLHTLAGLHPGYSGDIFLQERRLTEIPRKTVAQQLGLLLQQQEDHFPGTVLETVLVGRHPHLKSWQWETEHDVNIARDALIQVGLQDFAHRSIQTLSGGERQRVALATLITQQTPVMLLDEPINHLDIHQQHDVMQLLINNSSASTSLFVLHDVNLAARYCNKAILLLGNGQFRTGLCEDVLSELNLSELYNHAIEKIIHKGHSLFIPV